MADMNERRRTAEEEYFRRKEQQLIERLRAKAQEESHRKGLAEAVGLENQQILDVLKDMGFDRATVVLLYLVPLLEVAWSDGSVAEKERELILEAARKHGVTEGSAAYTKLVGWLARKPDVELFNRAIAVIRDIVGFQSEEALRATGLKMVDACRQVAAAAGGFLGLGSKISPEEEAALRRVVSEIEKGHVQAATKVTKALQS